MKIEMGESLIYSWLRHVRRCQIVQTNWKASSQWPLHHEVELGKIFQATIDNFKQYTPFKADSSLAQVIRQGECDLLGLRMTEAGTEVVAVDVAFHEAGLNYGSREKTVGKIVEKCVRTAVCVYGYLDVKEADIVFASPKVGGKLNDEITQTLKVADTMLQTMGYKFHLRLLANTDFNNEVLQPVLALSGDVADTTELFLRSYQMTKLFDRG